MPVACNGHATGRNLARRRGPRHVTGNKLKGGEPRDRGGSRSNGGTPHTFGRVAHGITSYTNEPRPGGMFALRRIAVRLKTDGGISRTRKRTANNAAHMYLRDRRITRAYTYVIGEWVHADGRDDVWNERSV